MIVILPIPSQYHKRNTNDPIRRIMEEQSSGTLDWLAYLVLIFPNDFDSFFSEVCELILSESTTLVDDDLGEWNYEKLTELCCSHAFTQWVHDFYKSQNELNIIYQSHSLLMFNPEHIKDHPTKLIVYINDQIP